VEVGKGAARKRKRRDRKVIDLTSDCTPWETNDAVCVDYDFDDAGVNALKNIVSLGANRQDIKNSLVEFFFRFVRTYFGQTVKSVGNNVAVFTDPEFCEQEKRKLTLILVFERLRFKKDAWLNFKNQYDKDPEGSLCKVPLCHHVWRYSAQEADLIMKVCIEYSKSSCTDTLKELCAVETDLLLMTRSQSGNKKGAVRNPIV
jgi:hypothetical protein